MKKVICLIVVVVCIFTGICVNADEDYPNTYKVTASVLNVRFGPGIEYDSFYKLTNGEEIPGKENIGSWTEINCYGFKGFVFSDYIKNVSNQEVVNNEANQSSKTYLGRYYVTGYDPYCSHCCGKLNGITASGAKAVVGQTVAMKGVAFGTNIYIEGLGTYIVQDRGVGNGVIDVACNGHSACYAITGNYDVYIIN